ncbi:MAG TPA: VOC family protein [Ignavibacteria bacterium]|nr:VOC family protein [Ignavibacteria bacterium]
MKIPDNTKIQSVDLRVKDLNESLKFYSELLGFKIISRSDKLSLLSADGELPYLVKLFEDKNAEVRGHNSAGLFHIAFRFKNRKELARVFMRLFNNNVKFQGFSDHLVSEAIYLSDPDNNGIELYTDKPAAEWKWEMGQVIMDTLPLDLSKITAELDDPEIWNGIDPETDIGHIHLNVTDLFKSEKFYSLILGLNVTSSLYPGAVFYSAGGYHHHIGTNIWKSRNGKPVNIKSEGLINFTIKIPDEKYINSIFEKAKEEGLLLENRDGNDSELLIKDFDGNVMKIEL